jgi:hypothetical protein
MNLSMIFAVAAMAGAVLLLVQTSNRIWPLVAVIAAGIHLLILTRIVHLSISGLSLSLVLGLALAVAGVMCWLKVSSKLHVSAATVVALLGLIMAANVVVR